MVLNLINGNTVNIAPEEIKEYWYAVNEGCTKVVIEQDDSTIVTYKVTNTVAEIDIVVWPLGDY